MSAAGVAAVVVTYNRLSLLRDCVAALQTQTRPPAAILVVNNASSDGTHAYLDALASRHQNLISVTHLAQNTGGAGGFFEGLRMALANGADWVWMMDDDARPHLTALEELMKVAKDPTNLYGSLATKGPDTSWSTTLLDPHSHTVDSAVDVPNEARVQSLPFLGFMIHRELVEQIGLPDAGYFIAADDVEYCMRAERAGAQLIIAGQSRIEHPKSDRYEARLPGRHLICLRLPPWKRYYDTRNRLLNARKYYGTRLLSQTLPGLFVRLFAALWCEPRKLAQLWAFAAGMFDGLLGIKGRRHTKWGIRQ